MEIIYILYLVLAVYGFYKLYSRYNLNDDTEIEFDTVNERIDYLNQLKQQLQSIEEMITDIESCQPDELEKVFRCEWSGAVGERFAYDLWVDGESHISKELLKIAYSERQRLRASLKAEIRNLSDRCNENCNENYAISGSRGGHV